MLLRAPSLAPLLTLIAACATTAASPSAAPEPPPAAPAPPPTSAALKPAEGVVSLTLSCSAEERDNGVDDDCDGHIDEDVGGRRGALELALAWNGPAGLTLRTEPALDSAAEAACSTQGACTARLIDDGWQREPLTLVVQRDGDSPEPASLTASLCVAAHGMSLGCHNFTLAPGQAREVARLTAP